MLRFYLIFLIEYYFYWFFFLLWISERFIKKTSKWWEPVRFNSNYNVYFFLATRIINFWNFEKFDSLYIHFSLLKQKSNSRTLFQFFNKNKFYKYFNKNSELFVRKNFMFHPCLLHLRSLLFLTNFPAYTIPTKKKRKNG